MLRRYLQALPRAQEIAAGRGPAMTRDQGLAPLGAILGGLRGALEGPGGSNLRAHLAADGNGEAYVQVTSLLNGEYSGTAPKRVVLDVFLEVFSPVRKQRRAFDRDVGYDIFAAALEGVGHDAPITTLSWRVLELRR